ncbi:hypothetical protein LSUB1_G005757 [Lachnellula subtilissima]|uniref:Rhodopsin domain-containing protein n=1 Tax=Lachnellula subtilissima TaxID=602034 RepID=A0A8H8U6H6_9HELO|nr:hypothetical protein LSUB1_G005757 [Lachnellula subtilissima]
MLFGFGIAITALFTITQAAFNLSVLSELPACTVVSAQVNQNLICGGIPQPSRRTEIIRFISIITAVTSPFIMLQGMSRYLVTKLWWDDGIMLIAGAIKIAIAAVSCGGLSFTFGVIFQCSPVRAAWDLTVDAKCIDSKGIVYSGAAISIVEDFLIMFLPLPLLKGLNLSLRKRIALAFMFAIGSFSLHQETPQITDPKSGVNVDPVIWSVFEVYAAIICSSIMTIRPLLVKYFPRTFGSERSTPSNTSFSASWRTRIGFHQELRPWSNNNGVELLSQENFVEPRNHKSIHAIRVENNTTFEENVRADDRANVW